MSYKYTAHFLAQDLVGVINQLFTSLCCECMGVWFSNLVLIGHKRGSSEVLSVSWNDNTCKFEWREDFSRSTTQRAKSVCVDDVLEAVFLLTK